MQLRMWMLDIAREQSPTLDQLRRYLDVTVESGYNAIGLYLEHRFAYPSAPWAHGKGCVTPEMVKTLEAEYSDLQIIPFINLLGHFEGMLYTEYGKRFREETFKGLQACPSCPEFVNLCRSLIDDTLSTFSSEIIHIGGDETWQLGACEKCKARMESSGKEDGKAVLYAEHFGPLAQQVVDVGRRPAVWGDMFLDHPTALDAIPQQTLIFDWQYFNGPKPTAQQFIDRGFAVVGSPAIQTYNAVWCHLKESEQNVRDHVQDMTELGGHGVCVTTWELGLFGNYETLIPMIKAAGRMLSGDPGVTLLDAYAEVSDDYGEWAKIMSDELALLGGMFGPGRIRSSLKCRLLLYSNPFLCWLYHHEELCGETGDKALALLARATEIAPNASARGVSEFGRLSIEFVRYADQARQAYAQALPGVAVSSLTPCRQIFESLEKIARANHLNAGGSLADIKRCRAAKEHVERVMLRIKEFGDGSLGYLPAFEIITHPKFMPHDQASWWLINRWANE
ncbi:MAG TPA: family 20 glycosylhydrolase [Fimbriimonadaceae bacterium]|nr:family 20 glycosylhydrolase [Fimbriimonadaceae bacterium]